MPRFQDGPASPLFEPLRIRGNVTMRQLAEAPVSQLMRDHSIHAPTGECTCYGIPFALNRIVLVQDAPVRIPLKGVSGRWLVFLHTTDFVPEDPQDDYYVPATRGHMRLAEHVADYVFEYEDGSEERVAVRRRHQINMFSRSWGENSLQSVAHQKPHPLYPMTEQFISNVPVWGGTQTRTAQTDIQPWLYWVWPWENPRPKQPLKAVRVENSSATLVLAGLTLGHTADNPVRWEPRRKAVLRLPEDVAFDPRLDEKGRLRQIQLDLGQVIHAAPRRIYPNDRWSGTSIEDMPAISEREILVEYTAHAEAHFHFEEGAPVPVTELQQAHEAGSLTVVASASRRVRLRVVDKATQRPVAVKLHVHGEAGEYLAPLDRHRLPNPAWFEDYSCDYVDENRHYSTYISGETTIDLPLGRAYIEATKGFEIAPVRKAVRVTKKTEEITLELEKVLPWRERGWVTADTHVHFLSPTTAELEGAGEGVNVINLLASQWGELFTNIGDFDGKTTFGSREAGGDGEYLVRVGTENRQHVLGHISLLGYDGDIIAPITTGGPDESALGDPVECLVSDWARRCREQKGLVVFPHWPEPRAENAATLIEGGADAIEITTAFLRSLSPYSLSDWYRYLNCGYFYPAVGGTDKMGACMEVGRVRTYAKLPADTEFTYEAWKDAIRSGNTFVTVGPVMEFAVEGKPAGSRIDMTASGGTVDVTWEVASCMLPVSRVELVVNGEIRQSKTVGTNGGSGTWRVKLDRSSWLALLVRSQKPRKPESVAAHSSPVMVKAGESAFFSAADALTILDQLEGSLAYLDTIATRGDRDNHKRMRLLLTSAYRKLHNQMHEHGYGHLHSPVSDHTAHH
jgi:hypothetical protein